MLWIYLLVTVLGPVLGCLLFVFLATDPNVLSAATGAIVGMMLSLATVFAFN